MVAAGQDVPAHLAVVLQVISKEETARQKTTTGAFDCE